MKQIIQSYKTGELWLADVPAPALKSNGAVVQSTKSLVSAGTERMIMSLAKKSLIGKAKARPDLVKQVLAKIKSEGFTNTMTKVFAKLDTPISLGYSCAGQVVEVGSRVDCFAPGDRVACGGAGYAAHSELNYIPKNLMVKIPNNVSDEDACFTTVGSIAMQGVRQAELTLGERVVVVGLGLLGLLTVQILKASGCAVLGTDLDPAKCELAKQLGADDAVSSDLENATEVFTQGRGADAVIITAATPSNGPIETAAEISRMKGRVIVVGLVGMDIPRDPFYKKELDLRLSMSYGPGRYDANYEEGGQDYPFSYVRWTEQRNMESFLYLVSTGAVTPSALVTHRYVIDDALKAYDLLDGKSESGEPENYLGIVIDYPHREIDLKQERTVELTAKGSGGKVGAGFIGAGNFTKAVLLPAVKRNEDVNLLGLCTATGMSGVETAKKNDIAVSTTDYESLLENNDVNALFITTQHNTHYRFATDALKAGKHVFLEKPLCIKEQELADIIKVKNDLGDNMPCLLVGFNRRFSPHAKAMRDAFAKHNSPIVVNYRINAGVIPRDVWIQDPELGGGRMIGEGCHFIDFCEYIIGAKPIKVFASSVCCQDTRHVSEDSVVVTINYEDGSLATIQYLAHGAKELAKERVEVFADGVSAVMDDFKSTVFYGGKNSPVKGKQAKGFDEEIDSFVNVVKNGGAWPIEFDSLVRTTALTFAVRESLRTNKAIDLDTWLEGMACQSDDSVAQSDT